MPTRAEKPTNDEIRTAVEALGDEQLTALYDEWSELTEAQADVETELFTRITQLTGAADEEGDEGEADGEEEPDEEDDAADDEEDEEQDEAA